MDASGWSALVLTGGTAVRLDGTDKAGLEVGGRTLLDRALASTSAAAEVVVVGPRVPTDRPVAFTREDPPSGGPVAALAAGLAALPRRLGWVVVLAVDMPLVSAATVQRLLEAADGADPKRPTGQAIQGARLCDAKGRAQHLCAAYDVAALVDRIAALGDPHGRSMHRLVEPLRLVDVPAVGAEAHDLDTWADLHQLQSLL